MKYLSVCSGVEAASVAWEPLDWEPVAFSEIEPFPSAVLAERFPDVPNLGDMTKYEEWNIPAIDLLVGGTPCQAFSVAGKRGSLEDDRGNLCLTFCRMADYFRPRWVLWENVPGVLSTTDNAFGSFLAALCGADAPVIPTRGRKHQNSGVVSGPKRTVAWRVLDAQWLRVPQRRKRVFVLAVAGSGNWACADALLPVGESVPGNLEARRKARKEAAGNAGSRFEGLSDVTPTIDASYGDKWTGDQYCFHEGFFVHEGHAVRRLTPRECERLQGFPDDWTLIPWRGKPAADCPDSHRYKAVGNSMAVPVMQYIGGRIQIVEGRRNGRRLDQN